MSWQLLIVEDDADIAEALADVFKARGYRVETASNGKEAIDRVCSSGMRPDAILLDLLMPVMDGHAFLRARSSEPLLAEVPIVIITAQPDIAANEDEGVYARFDKPLSLRQVVDTVERACHRGPPGGATVRRGSRAA
jgi:CheY-like chemotaxis protein